MNLSSSSIDTDDIAAEALDAFDASRQIAPFSGRRPGFDLALAYRAAACIRERRMARGELPVGRKIGFTNRTIWPEYGVWAPIWGDMFDSTARDLPASADGFTLGRFAEPRIEPEIVFGLAHAPAAGMDDAALLGCIDWVAHGFEIVQSIYPGWRFAAADSVAACGMHAALLIGPRRAVGDDEPRWLAALASFEIELSCDGVPVDRGRAANMLDGPLAALRHLEQALANEPLQPALAAGEIVTTGTLTRAFPIAAGQTWATALNGVPLDGIEVRFT